MRADPGSLGILLAEQVPRAMVEARAVALFVFTVAAAILAAVSKEFIALIILGVPLVISRAVIEIEVAKYDRVKVDRACREFRWRDGW